MTEVVVNEPNPSARGFYEHVGFAVCGRSERDEQGGPFPILYMKLNDNNKPNMEKAIAKDLLWIGAVFLRPEPDRSPGRAVSKARFIATTV